MTLDLEKYKKKKKIRRKKTLSSEVHSGYKMLFAAVLAMNLALGASFFIINSQKTVLGYKLRQLQLTQDSLRDDAKKIDNNIVNERSFKNIEKNAEKHNMASTQYIWYTNKTSRRAQR